MRERASKLSGKDLIDAYTDVVMEINKELSDLRLNGNFNTELNKEIPTILKDKYAGLYAEILARLGANETVIAKMLRLDTFLMYEHGEEYQFLKCKAN